ncbi:MAG TPA: HD domain-containing protein [Candidatus Woesebacteria bacterium]|jgi:hypothetical protein|nr:HD domain-containing protein [Candidatus Woesebacteria bacterium]
MKLDTKTYTDNLEIDNALKFLVKKVNQHCHNTKPLLSHCIRVAFRLDSLGYKKDIVIAALLHDLIEDTDTSISEIEKRFGKKIANLVTLLTFDMNINDKLVRYQSNFSRCKKNKTALLIRSSDLMENSFYYHKAGSLATYQFLLQKMSYFIQVAKPKLSDEKLFKDLIVRYNFLKKHENFLYK